MLYGLRKVLRGPRACVSSVVKSGLYGPRGMLYGPSKVLRGPRACVSSVVKSGLYGSRKVLRGPCINLQIPDSSSVLPVSCKIRIKQQQYQIQ